MTVCGLLSSAAWSCKASALRVAKLDGRQWMVSSRAFVACI
jgi:hypothetical protein